MKALWIAFLITTPCLAMQNITQINPALLNPEGLTFEQAAERLTGEHAQTYRLADLAKVQSWISKQHEKHAPAVTETQLLAGVFVVAGTALGVELYHSNPVETLSEAWFYGQAATKSRFIDGGVITLPAILGGLKVGGSIAAPVLGKIGTLIAGGLLYRTLHQWVYGNMQEQHKRAMKELRKEVKGHYKDSLAKFKEELAEHQAKTDIATTQARMNAVQALQTISTFEHKQSALLTDLSTQLKSGEITEALATVGKIQEEAALHAEPEEKHPMWQFWKKKSKS